jgi:hypothetical protein
VLSIGTDSEQENVAAINFCVNSKRQLSEIIKNRKRDQTIEDFMHRSMFYLSGYSREGKFSTV